MSVAKTILEQLGGNKFRVMTGAKNFMGDENSLSMRIGGNSSNSNYLKITLNSWDLYDMKFCKLTRKFEEKSATEYKNIYNSLLPDTLVWRSSLGNTELLSESYLRHPAYSDYPVVGVSWIQAVQYCKWRTSAVNLKRLIDKGVLSNVLENDTIRNFFDTDLYLENPYKLFDGDSTVYKRGLPDNKVRKKGAPRPEKGAFTGATDRKDGKFLVANGGTIFLDEIGDMSPSLQAKVLRVLESGEIERVGGAETMTVDVRVISATNQDLDKMIRDGKFRQDLFHRLNVFPVTLPPLKDRKGDIPLLSMIIIKKLQKKYNMPVNYIGPEAMELLGQYDWPGNIRELENTLERRLLISNNKHLMKDDIVSVLSDEAAHTQAQKQFSPSESLPVIDSTDTNGTPPTLPQATIVNPVVTHEVKTLKDLEKEAIVLGLERTKWNLTLTAKQLGISRMTLYRKLEQHGLRDKD